MVLVHGFTQTGASWQPVASRLEKAGHRVVAPDCPGHGEKADVAADLTEGARLLAAECSAGAWVGYSMGGRLALHVALNFPEVVHRLVLVSATPGIEEAEARARRRAEDEERAQSLLRDGVEPFLDGWLQGPLFATLPGDMVGLEARLSNTPEGLASSLRLAGTGNQQPLWDRLAELSTPVLVVAGSLDEKFVDIGRRMGEAIPQAELVLLEGGHAVHLERPDEFSKLVDRFLTG